MTVRKFAGLIESEVGLIPEDWKIKEIEFVAKVVGGGTPSTKQNKYWGGNVSWITPKDLSGHTNRYIGHGERSITAEGLKNSNTKIIPSNSILLTTRAPIGYIAISQNELTTNQGLHSLIPNVGISPLFLYYLLKNNVEWLKSNANGSTFEELSGSALKNLKFAFPEFDEQTNISKILSDLDSKIELNHQMNKTLESIAQALFKHWFIDFEFPDENGNPYKSSGGEMTDSELGEIPKEWKNENFGNVIRFTKGKKPREIRNESTINFSPLILIGALDGNEPLYGDPLGMNFLRKYDSVLVMDGASSGRIEIGFEGILGSTIASITAKDERLSNFYIYHYLKNIQKEIAENTTGTAIPHSDKKRVEMKRITIPDKETLSIFSKFSKIVIDYIFIKRSEIVVLTNIRDLLLPKLMSGKIRVPVED